MSNTVAVVEQTFVERVMSIIKGDDQSKVKKFQKRAVQILNQNIKAKESVIETLEYELADAKERQADTAINIDVDKCTGAVGSMDSYIGKYINDQERALEAVEAIEEKIEEANKSIAKSKVYISKLK